MSQSNQRSHPSPTVAVWLLLVLTFVTGLVDAVGYLALDHVFVGNMTGNIVILGMALAGADGLPVLGPAVALLAFALSAYVGGLFLRRRRKIWSTAVTTLLAIGASLLALVGLAFLVPSWTQSHAHVLMIVASTTTAAAMGLQAAVARSLAVADMTTVVVTSTLTSLASESLVDGGVKGLWNRRFGAIVTILVGACIGALLVKFGPAIPLLLAALLTAVTVAAGHSLLHLPAEGQTSNESDHAHV